MILYATKLTYDRFSIEKKYASMLTDDEKMLREAAIKKDSGDPLYEWAVKLFYFDGKKCLACTNFATKFTIFIINIHADEVLSSNVIIYEYIVDMFRDDDEFFPYLADYLNSSPFSFFAPLKDKSGISSVNRVISDFAIDGYRFYDYISDGILHTKKINYDANFDYICSVKIDNRREYIYPGEFFRETVMNRFRKPDNILYFHKADEEQ